MFVKNEIKYLPKYDNLIYSFKGVWHSNFFLKSLTSMEYQLINMIGKDLYYLDGTKFIKNSNLVVTIYFNLKYIDSDYCENIYKNYLVFSFVFHRGTPPHISLLQIMVSIIKQYLIHNDNFAESKLNDSELINILDNGECINNQKFLTGYLTIAIHKKNHEDIYKVLTEEL